MSQAEKIAIQRGPLQVFALSKAEADRMGMELAKARTSLRDVKSHLEALGYRRDGVSTERVLASFNNHVPGG